MKRYRLTRLGKIVVFSFAALLIMVSLGIYNLTMRDVAAIARRDMVEDLDEDSGGKVKPEVNEPNATSQLVVYADGQPQSDVRDYEEIKKLKASIFFQPDSKVLEGEYDELLNMFVQVSGVVADCKIKIEGNTATLYKNPNKELEKYYNSLSMDRAAKIASVLQKKGIASERIVAVGNGATKPAKDNDTTEGRAYNRRVDIYFVESASN